MIQIEALAVAILTVGLVVTRPRGLNEGVAALSGGVLVIVLRLVQPHEAVVQELASWNVFLFFLGMMTVAALADQAGVFDRLAYLAARWSRRRVIVLYIAVYLLGAAISIGFANDSAALVLTPIVYALVLRLRIDPLPFVFATTFVADTASLLLPVSNPLNVIVADGFHLTLTAYLSRLWLPALLVIAINLGVFLIMFRRSLRGQFAEASEPPVTPGTWSALGILLCLAVAYLLASARGFPLGIVACGGGVILGIDRLRLRKLDPARLVQEVSWPIFGFIGGMLLVVQALHDSGITSQFGSTLASLGSGSPLAAITVTMVGAALGSNVINNLPMGLVMVSTVHAVHVPAAIRADMVYGTIVGCDLGPNLTHLGSLATFLWLFFLRRKGLNVSTWDYFKIGVVVTPLLLAGAIIGLYSTG